MGLKWIFFTSKIYFSLDESSFDYNLSDEDYSKVKVKLTNLLNSVTKYAVEKYAQLVTKRSNAKYVFSYTQYVSKIIIV